MDGRVGIPIVYISKPRCWLFCVGARGAVLDGIIDISRRHQAVSQEAMHITDQEALLDAAPKSRTDPSLCVCLPGSGM